LYHKILILLLFYCFAAAIGDCCVLDLDSISSYIKLLWVMFYDIPILKFSYWYYGLALPSLTYYWCILMCYDIDTQDQCMSNTKRIYFSMNFSQCVAWVLNHSKITTSFFCFRFRLWTRHPISLSSDKSSIQNTYFGWILFVSLRSVQRSVFDFSLIFVDMVTVVYFTSWSSAERCCSYLEIPILEISIHLILVDSVEDNSDLEMKGSY
jgi:hypothetical protein